MKFEDSTLIFLTKKNRIKLMLVTKKHDLFPKKGKGITTFLVRNIHITMSHYILSQSEKKRRSKNKNVALSESKHKVYTDIGDFAKLSKIEGW
jgi:hypothetical protein